MSTGRSLRTFSLVRGRDGSGVSGTGRVLDGVVFHNGKVAVCWRTDVDGARHGASSVGLYDSYSDFEFIHIGSHPENGSQVVWHNP